MDMQDRSIVRPVLSAMDNLRAAEADLAVYYRIVDAFCAQWNGALRERTRLQGDEIIYLIHVLLGEYLRFEGNNRRVALWLLTIHRCCRNRGAALDEARRELGDTMRSADLSFDDTLLEPILKKVQFFEERHEEASRNGLGE